MGPTITADPGERSPGPARVVVVGSGFAGFHCLRGLAKLLPADAADLVVVSPTDYMLYLSLLPEVAAGIVDPRHIAVSLSSALPRATLVPSHVVAADVGTGTVEVLDPEGRRRAVGFDRLVLAPGSVTRMLPIPGSAERAKGFKTLAQALYLRDHVLAQLELADACSDPVERAARCTFVVVGAGYTGTEVAAQGQLFSRAALRRYPRIRPDELRWLLVDLAADILPELGERLGRPALRILRARDGCSAADDRCGGQLRRRTTVRRDDRADPHPRLVRRGDPGTTGRRAEPAHGEGAAGGGRVPDRAGPAGRLRVRGRRR